MLTALEQAQMAVRQAAEYYEVSEQKDGNAHYRSMSEREYAKAAVYAAVAQAEALERIASMLERTVSWDANQENGNLRVDTGA